MLHHVGTTGSTNADLRVLANQGSPHGTAVLAEAQTAGKGRLGRAWESPPGSALLLSILIRRPLPAVRVPLLCLGAATVVAQVCGDPLTIKWPNDVLAPDGRKVAGILAEAEFQKGRLSWAIIGIGVNVHAAPPLPTATHLADVPGCRTDRDLLAAHLVHGVCEMADGILDNPGFMLDVWRSRNATLGREVRIGDLQGLAIDIEESGALVIQLDDGTRHRVLAGDVHMIG